MLLLILKFEIPMHVIEVISSQLCVIFFRLQYVMEYSKEINSLLGNPNSSPSLAIEDSRELLKVNIFLSGRMVNFNGIFGFKLQILLLFI